MKFKTIKAWLWRWKTRSPISSRKIVGKANDNDASAANSWTRDILPSFMQNYAWNCIYNCDGTVLYFHATPSDTLRLRGGKQAAIERITILSCANTDISHKLPLFGKRSSSFYTTKNITNTAHYTKEELEKIITTMDFYAPEFSVTATGIAKNISILLPIHTIARSSYISICK